MSFKFHLDQIDQAAQYVIDHLDSPIICFEGDMGAGKTTLISSLCRLWKVDGSISSPTFSIVNQYHSKTKGKIYHFDFYRLNNTEEALDIGVEEYLDSQNHCLIEWGERIKNILPHDHNKVEIMVNEDQSRTINIVSI